MISQTSQNQETAKALWLPGMENRDWSGFDFDSSRSNANPAGVRITADTALYSTVVLSCVRILGESVASLPLNLYKKLPGGGKELQDQNPLFEVLHSTPNSWQTSYEFFEQLMLHVTLHGNAYAYIKSGAKGAVTELIPLHPSRMQVERLENGRLRYRYSEEYGKQKIYSQDRVMHVRWLSDDGVVGMVPVQLSQDAIALSRACEIHGASYFGQGARPGVVLETDQVLEQSSASALRENWERMHRGAANASRTAVLMGGLKAHEIGTSNVDSQFLESRRFQVEEVCRVFRIPPHLVGDLSRSSFSNIEQQSIDFLQHTLQPWLNRLQAVIARDILGDDSLFAEFDPRQMLRGDVAARGSYYTTLWNLGVTSINELRAWESLNPIPEGDQRFVQLNMQTVDEAQSKGQVAVKQAEDVLQGENEEEEVAVEEGTIIDGDTSHPEGSETVGEISMSGSQIGGILQVLEQLSAGLLDKNAAAALISSAFPTIPEKHVQSLVNGTQEKEVQPVPPQLGGPEVPPAEGEQVEVEEEQPQEQLELPLEDEEEPEDEEDEEDEDLSEPEERAGSVGPDCGTGGGGFKAGNSCAKGGQSTGSSEKSKKSKGGGSEGGSSGGGGAAVAESGKKKDEGSLGGLGTKPIDKYLDVQGTTEDRKVAMNVIEAADKINGVPSDYSTRLKIDRPVESIEEGSAHGMFMPSKDSEGRVPVGGKKDTATIVYRNDLNHSKHMVVAHEIGHHVDYEVLGKDGVPFSRYNRKFDDSDGKIAAAKNELSNAFKESESYKFNRLALSNDPSAGKQLVEMGYPEGETFKAFMNENVPRKTQTRMNTYLQDSQELFARAYAQKVGNHSGEAGIELWSRQRADKDIGTLQYRDKKKRVPWRFNNGATKMQWSDSDFKKIDKAMDKLFREVGVLNSSATGTGGEDE